MFKSKAKVTPSLDDLTSRLIASTSINLDTSRVTLTQTLASLSQPSTTKQK